MGKYLVFQSDFGLVDGAVSAMKGVAYKVSGDLILEDLTHDITPYNIFEGSYRLYQTTTYWPEGTVFVSVVDPGVGSDRLSVVVKTKDNKYIVTPNNGTLTHIAKSVGIEAMRQISETTNRLQDSEESYTFHGRDVYAYTGARLASGIITFEEVGPELNLDQIVYLDTFKTIVEEDSVTGQIDILDVRFGSLWTSISKEEFNQLGFKFGDYVTVEIRNHNSMVYCNKVPYAPSFAEVPIGSPMLYMNSVYSMALAINQGSFSKAYNIGVGNHWTITLRK